jgi:hypothetical protein
MGDDVAAELQEDEEGEGFDHGVTGLMPGDHDSAGRPRPWGEGPDGAGGSPASCAFS